MPLTNHVNQTIGHDSVETRRPLATALPKAGCKGPGIRAGVFQDWRQGSTRGKAASRSGKALRDGR
ncbi:MAG TPA: hypothetical protein VJT15_14670 [Pyrinomonadaceae bacterium]|nr:hypothetical protein [Pyrinomonadaceae bacterium]